MFANVPKQQRAEPIHEVMNLHAVTVHLVRAIRIKFQKLLVGGGVFAKAGCGHAQWGKYLSLEVAEVVLSRHDFDDPAADEVP